MLVGFCTVSIGGSVAAVNIVQGWDQSWVFHVGNIQLLIQVH